MSTHPQASMPDEGRELAGDFVGDRLYNDLTAFVRNAPPHTRLASARTLAGKYGISPASVMLVVDRLAAAGLVYKVHGKGCFVAEARQNQPAAGETILFCYSQQAMPHLYYSNMRDAVIENATLLGYRLQVRPLIKKDGQTYSQEWLQIFRDLSGTDVAAMIVPWVEPGCAGPIRTLRPDLPVLVTQSLFPGQEYSSVMQDMFCHGYEAGRYLLENCGIRNLAAVHHGAAFLAGMRAAVAEFQPDAKLEAFSFDRLSYPAATAAALVRSGAAGVAFSEDIAAREFLRQAMELEPDFLETRRIIAHSNIEYNILPPPVARLENDGREFGATVMSTLHSLIRGRFPGKVSVGIKPRLRLPFTMPAPGPVTPPPLPMPPWENHLVADLAVGGIATHYSN